MIPSLKATNKNTVIIRRFQRAIDFATTTRRFSPGGEAKMFGGLVWRLKCDFKQI